jgi:hypothetical protein
MNPSSTIEAAAQSTAFHCSYIVPAGEPPPFWPGIIPHSYIVFSPQRPKRPRRRRISARKRSRSDAWLKLAGALEVAADGARQAARAARTRDPAALDSLIDRWRLAVLEAIGIHNVDDEFLVTP